MLPLADRRVLITRAREQGSALATHLEALGAETILIPTIELVAPESWDGLDAALKGIGGFDWVVFTSANAVGAMVERARVLEVAARARRVAAIGPATAQAASEAGLTVDLMPAQAVAESLAEALRPHAQGASVLLVRAAVARDVLPETLTAAGARVTIAEAYRTVVAADSVEELCELFSTRPPDAITFTSASTARNLVALLEAAGVTLPQGMVLASIGPITSQAMRELGLEPTVEAKETTIAGLVEGLTGFWEQA